MSEKLEILKSYYIDGISIRQISRDTKISRNTVRKYIKEFNNEKSVLFNNQKDCKKIVEMLIEPKYDSSNRVKTVLTEEISKELDIFIRKNEDKKNTGKRKLCMKATDMHEELINMGYEISYSTVNNYVRENSKKMREAFIKQSYNPREICEFDFGDVLLNINGVEKIYKLAVFTLAYSNIRYALIYRNADTEAFIDSHIKFFEYLGKVPHQMVYDNMKVAVKKFVGRTEKQATSGLMQLSVYYGFDFRFCNICKGNEKGHVERSVEIIRRKAFSANNVFESLEEANENLCKKTEFLNSKREKEFLEEKINMNEKMPKYLNLIKREALVDKFSTVVFRNNHYSVPDTLINKEVTISATVEDIRIFYKNEPVAQHKRSYETGVYLLNIFHYLKTFKRKPGALKNSLCLINSEEIYLFFKKYFYDTPKEFIKIITFFNDYEFSKIENAANKIKNSGAVVNFESLKMILMQKDYEDISFCKNEVETACIMQLKSYEEAVLWVVY